ncbi:hypothetical protein [Candidatus Enterococcus clewellii]|uniref:Uncharacterized protein n=1 Tax=Candidatus Enterococcus clewellii TaxID=1834193 RepID=A0A242K768_9ENTE|nr:hypothetical protein [Enterococcus sp. 9E7_DIV0242]OTP16066.1 hypothetical protein A5888_002280 [Enterococcus sp. 9E7_DIV0242]
MIRLSGYFMIQELRSECSNVFCSLAPVLFDNQASIYKKSFTSLEINGIMILY